VKPWRWWDVRRKPRYEGVVVAVVVLKQWCSDSRGRGSLQYRQVKSKRERQFAVVRIARRGSVLPLKQPKHESRGETLLC
jgi:hypothetical protein